VQELDASWQQQSSFILSFVGERGALVPTIFSSDHIDENSAWQSSANLTIFGLCLNIMGTVWGDSATTLGLGLRCQCHPLQGRTRQRITSNKIGPHSRSVPQPTGVSLSCAVPCQPLGNYQTQLLII
jgi:hypothetical protein